MADVPAYEEAVKKFEIADAEYQALQHHIESGELLKEILDRSLGNHETAVELWTKAWDKLRDLNIERSVKLRNAKDALRQAVVLSPTQERGPNGTATILTSGEFTVSSNTRRSFDAKSLMGLCAQAGILKELMDLTYTTAEGKVEKAVEQVWNIEYQKVYAFLVGKGQSGIINGAYEERESTPAVKGPKDLAFLGEKKEK